MVWFDSSSGGPPPPRKSSGNLPRRAPPPQVPGEGPLEAREAPRPSRSTGAPGGVSTLWQTPPPQSSSSPPGPGQHRAQIASPLRGASRLEQHRNPSLSQPSPPPLPDPPHELVLRAYQLSNERGFDWLRFSGFFPKLKFFLAVGLPSLALVGVLLLLPSDVREQFLVPILLAGVVVDAFIAAVILRPIMRPIRRAARQILRATSGVRSAQQQVLELATSQKMAQTILADATKGVMLNFNSVATGTQAVGTVFADAYQVLVELAQLVEEMKQQRQQAGRGMEEIIRLQRPIKQLHEILIHGYSDSADLMRFIQEHLAADRLMRVQASGADVTEQFLETERRIRDGLQQMESIQMAEQDLLR